jgi:hypothetical protein
MTRPVRTLYAIVGAVVSLIIAIRFVFHGAEADRAREPQATRTAVEDDTGPKPDAQNPAAKIPKVVATLKGDSNYRFLKFEIWPGEYKNQRVWEIDYHYSERGDDGVFVLKHVAVYFRAGKIVGYGDPITADQAKPNVEEADADAVAKPYDVSLRDSSHRSEGSRSSGGKSRALGSDDGHYEGGSGSSHKGGHYSNENTGDRYRDTKAAQTD